MPQFLKSDSTFFGSIINVKPEGVYWFDSNSLIVSVPVGQEPVDVMTRFCLTEKGASVLSSLEERLERLA
jgi:hypothetical protein